jgi:hypothetical protein
MVTQILHTRWIDDFDATLLFRPFDCPMDGCDLSIAKASSTEARRTIGIFTVA